MKKGVEKQSGNIMLVVLMVGTVSTLLLSLAIVGPAYMEERAVEQQLAELRVRWAIIGDFRYALSRTNHSKLCVTAGACSGATKLTDVNKAAALQAYLNEIISYQVWTYPEEVSAYLFNVTLTASPDDTAGKNAYSGHLMMKGNFTGAQSTMDLLSGATGRMGPLEMRFCAGLSFVSSGCGAIGVDNGGVPTSFYSVKRLTRLVPGS